MFLSAWHDSCSIMFIRALAVVHPKKQLFMNPSQLVAEQPLNDSLPASNVFTSVASQNNGNQNLFFRLPTSPVRELPLINR